MIIKINWMELQNDDLVDPSNHETKSQFKSNDHNITHWQIMIKIKSEQ